MRVLQPWISFGLLMWISSFGCSSQRPGVGSGSALPVEREIHVDPTLQLRSRYEQVGDVLFLAISWESRVSHAFEEFTRREGQRAGSRLLSLQRMETLLQEGDRERVLRACARILDDMPPQIARATLSRMTAWSRAWCQMDALDQSLGTEAAFTIVHDLLVSIGMERMFLPETPAAYFEGFWCLAASNISDERNAQIALRQQVFEQLGDAASLECTSE